VLRCTLLFFTRLHVATTHIIIIHGTTNKAQSTLQQCPEWEPNRTGTAGTKTSLETSHSPARDRLPPPTSEIPARQSNTPPTTNTASQRHSVKYYTHARTHVQARQPRCVRYRTGAGPEGAPPPRERVSPFAVITVSCTPAPVQALAVRDSAMYHQPAFCVVNPAVRLALYIAVCRT
jgi:hypothetical protein